MKQSGWIFLFTFFCNASFGQAFLERGLEAFNTGKNKEAIRWFDWAIAADTTDADRYLMRGRAKRAIGKNESATTDFKTAIERDAKKGDAYLFLALIDHESGDIKQTVKNCSLALKHKTYYKAEAHMKRAEAYSQLGRNDKAVKDYSSVIAIKDGNLATAHFKRGQLKMNMGSRKAALEDFKKVVELNPNNVQLTWDIGRISTELEVYQDAVTYYSMAIERVTEKSPQMYFIRGEAYEMVKNYEAAITDYTTTIELKGNLANAYYNRGQAKARLGDAKSACIDWKKASELGHPEAANVIVYNCK